MLYCLHQQCLQTGDGTEIDPTLFCQFLCAVLFVYVFLRQGGFVFVCICLYVDYSQTSRKIGME